MEIAPSGTDVKKLGAKLEEKGISSRNSPFTSARKRG